MDSLSRILVNRRCLLFSVPHTTNNGFTCPLYKPSLPPSPSLAFTPLSFSSLPLQSTKKHFSVCRKQKSLHPWTLLKDLVSWQRTMVWLPLQTRKLGILGIIITSTIINTALCRGLWVMPPLSIGAVSETFRFLRQDQGGSMMPGLKITNLISLKPAFSARSHLGITETSLCTGQRLTVVVAALFSLKEIYNLYLYRQNQNPQKIL